MAQPAERQTPTANATDPIPVAEIRALRQAEPTLRYVAIKILEWAPVYADLHEDNPEIAYLSVASQSTLVRPQVGQQPAGNEVRDRIDLPLPVLSLLGPSAVAALSIGFLIHQSLQVTLSKALPLLESRAGSWLTIFLSVGLFFLVFPVFQHQRLVGLLSDAFPSSIDRAQILRSVARDYYVKIRKKSMLLSALGVGIAAAVILCCLFLELRAPHRHTVSRKETRIVELGDSGLASYSITKNTLGPFYHLRLFLNLNSLKSTGDWGCHEYGAKTSKKNFDSVGIHLDGGGKGIFIASMSSPWKGDKSINVAKQVGSVMVPNDWRSNLFSLGDVGSYDGRLPVLEADVDAGALLGPGSVQDLDKKIAEELNIELHVTLKSRCPSFSEHHPSLETPDGKLRFF